MPKKIWLEDFKEWLDYTHQNFLRIIKICILSHMLKKLQACKFLHYCFFLEGRRIKLMDLLWYNGDIFLDTFNKSY